MGLKYKDIIEEMTLEEKASLMTGKDVWSTMDFPEKNIPSMVTSDGPHGLRKQVSGQENDLGFVGGEPATCFPTAATMANSWDEKLGEEVGNALGEECLYYGVNCLLGPGLNIKRSPLCGRNFEYFSEDPYLSGKMAASYVRGIQEKGVASCLKHFAANSQELRRMCTNSIVDERTFREIYTTGFEIAVKESKAKTIMASYNKVNGVYAFENHHLLKNILREEWGFDGAVMSDWGACNDIVESVRNGGNLEMPGCGFASFERVVDAVLNGELSEKCLDKRVDELLDVIFWSNETKNVEADFDREDHHNIARKAAKESIVLLKNEDSILPIKPIDKVAIIGDLAMKPRFQGGGSSIVTTSMEPESILGEISNYEIDSIGFSQGYILGGKINKELEEEAVDIASRADKVLLFVGLDDFTESEGFDRDNLDLPRNQLSLIEKVCEANKNIVMVFSSGAPFLMPFVDDVKGMLHGYLGGQAGASAMCEVIVGNHNPSGKLAETYPLSLDDTPCNSYYPGYGENCEYREGLYVGYRYYDSMDKEVLFPFGHGLSYTHFTYSDIEASEEKVSFSITNDGERSGAEIAQIYVGRKPGSVYRVKKELKGFKKVFLEAGETKRIEVEFDDKAFRYYDVNTMNWVVEPGTYDIYIGASVSDIILKQSINIGPCHASVPNYFIGNVNNISKEEFEALCGFKIKDDDNKELDKNDSISSLKKSKSLLGKVLVSIIEGKFNNGKKRGKPDAELSFVLDMPIRGIGKMTNGVINDKMVDSLVDVSNGHTIKGWKNFFKEKKRIKASKTDK